MFRCEGGGSSGSGIETIKRSTSGSHLDAREVVVADMLKCQKGPPLACIRMGGRVEAMEAALKPLKSPPPAHFWMQGRVTVKKSKISHWLVSPAQRALNFFFDPLKILCKWAILLLFLTFILGF